MTRNFILKSTFKIIWILNHIPWLNYQFIQLNGVNPCVKIVMQKRHFFGQIRQDQTLSTSPGPWHTLFYVPKREKKHVSPVTITNAKHWPITNSNISFLCLGAFKFLGHNYIAPMKFPTSFSESVRICGNITYFIFYLKIVDWFERERNINLLFQLSMHSLVDSFICPD